MKRFTLFAAIIGLAGCTTLQPIEGTADELQGRISSGGLLEVGDRVSIVTSDDRTHEFRIRALGEGVIQGTSDSVPLDRVVTLQKREFSRAKTCLLLGGIVLGVGLVLYAAAQVTPAFALGRAP
ncbi:MAG: hypothetical protein WA642_20180 [Steroidobacteraceae bacterium]